MLKTFASCIAVVAALSVLVPAEAVQAKAPAVQAVPQNPAPVQVAPAQTNVKMKSNVPVRYYQARRHHRHRTSYPMYRSNFVPTNQVGGVTNPGATTVPSKVTKGAANTAKAKTAIGNGATPKAKGTSFHKASGKGHHRTAHHKHRSSTKSSAKT